MIKIQGLDGLKALAGQALGVSEWHTVEQTDIDRFALATGDLQWIHVGADRAKAGPFGGTIAHGFLSLGMTTMLLWEVAEVAGYETVINYGVNRVRFPAVLPVNSRVRAEVILDKVREVPGGAEAVWAVKVEREGGDRPVCVAEIVFRYYGAAQ